MRENEDAGRFELEIGGRLVYADIERRPGVIVVLFVYAPPALRGTGAAGRLMQGIAERARREGARIDARCGYARSWLRGHPEHASLLAAG